MTKLTLEIYDDVVSALNKIQNLNDSGIELEIPEGAALFENVLNLKLIKKYADRYGITVHFQTTDTAGNNLLEMIEEGSGRFSNQTGDVSETGAQPDMPANIFNKKTKVTWLKKTILPKIGIKIPHFKSFLLPILVALVLVGVFHWNQSRREAVAKIVINSQPLTRSISIKARSGVSSDAQSKILAGTNIRTTLEVTRDITTTGEKIVGQKASGKAKIYNKTTEERDFKKGVSLVYEVDDKKFTYLTQGAATAPAAIVSDADDNPATPDTVTNGSIEIEIEAENVGADYNVTTDKTLEVKGQKKADFAAATSTEISGGKSETIKVVSEGDVTKLQAELSDSITQQASSSLTAKVAASQSLVEGSAKTTPVKETLSHKVGDEAEKLSITKSVEAEGLVYLKSELDRLLEALVKEFIPDGFVLSSKERQVSVAVLGNSSNSVLSSTEADLQVTLKTFVVPDISEDKIKDALTGKTLQEAQKFLGSVRNVKTYEFKMTPSLIPFFNKVPGAKDRIKVEIVRE